MSSDHSAREHGTEAGPDAADRSALAADLAALNLAIHQPSDPALFTRVPAPAMLPFHWRAAELEACLARIGEVLRLEPGGVRRTLRLTNPGLAFGTTPTLWASIQYILPGETASAHRHAASALRFIMKGEGASTTVGAETHAMNAGDLVLTPSWAFHDHVHRGEAPMVWLDVLDVSLVRSFDAVFFEASGVAERPVSAVPDRGFREHGSGIMAPPGEAPVANPVLLYPWRQAEAAILVAAALPPDSLRDTFLEYRNPASGGPALPTIGTALQRLRPGAELGAFRQTGSSVAYVVRGEGTSWIGGLRFDWGPGDFIAIPSWAAQRHANRSAVEDAWLFHASDAPALRSLGLWRETPCDTAEAGQ
ncbi:MAG: Gentisate 1,2-dioxygenase [Alphaproteobacteria bacterium]|nr:Gentisate 1,2-dioxygenase [Alphaproteobacteria bacterium]